jgi:6-phosphogluconolactonase
MPWIEHDYASRDALVAHMVDALVEACSDASRRNGSAWLALAGGQTPLPIYAALAKALPSASMTLVPTDERCVPHAHPASNVSALRAAFTGHASTVVNALTCEDGNETASLAQARALLALNAQPFDVVLLGMGADGHFASLFPGAANLDSGLDMDSGVDVIATLPDPLPAEAPFARISLTLPRLLRAHSVHLVITGEAKRHVLRRAQQAGHDPHVHPVAALLQAREQRVQIHWSP